MKYRLTEEQLNSLIAESTIRILRESSEDEGIGGTLGKGLGWLARKTANGVKDFGKNFGQQWGGQAQGQGQETGAGNGQQSLQQVQQQIQALSQQLNSLQQIVNNGGVNPANGGNAASDGNTAGGGNTAGNGNAANGGNAAQSEQLANQMNAALNACKKAGLVMQKDGNNRTFVTKDGSQRNQQQNQLVQAYIQAYNAWKNSVGAKNQLNINESKLNQIVTESIRNVLNGK